MGGDSNKGAFSISYKESADGLTEDHLQGTFFVGWPNPPSPATHLRLLQCTDHVVIAVDDATTAVVGFVTAISDGVSGGIHSVSRGRSRVPEARDRHRVDAEDACPTRSSLCRRPPLRRGTAAVLRASRDEKSDRHAASQLRPPVRPGELRPAAMPPLNARGIARAATRMLRSPFRFARCSLLRDAPGPAQPRAPESCLPAS